jgi:hypothetical protein
MIRRVTQKDNLITIDKLKGTARKAMAKQRKIW